MIAIPSDPPIWRNVFSTPEPTPALSTGTAPIAAAVIGVIVNDIPMPPMTKPGSMCQKLECTPDRERIEQQTASSVMPAAISQREPDRGRTACRRSARRARSSASSAGSAAPAWIGE